MVTQDEANRAEWEKAENWTSGSKWFCVYFSHADTRACVPKRIPSMGWTLNLAKPSAVAWLTFFLVGLPVLAALFAVAICESL